MPLTRNPKYQLGVAENEGVFFSGNINEFKIFLKKA